MGKKKAVEGKSKKNPRTNQKRATGERRSKTGKKNPRRKQLSPDVAELLTSLVKSEMRFFQYSFYQVDHSTLAGRQAISSPSNL